MHLTFTETQVEFLEFVQLLKMNELDYTQKENIINGLKERCYSDDGLRRKTYNMCREKWLSEYKMYKRTVG